MGQTTEQAEAARKMNAEALKKATKAELNKLGYSNSATVKIHQGADPFSILKTRPERLR